MTLLKFLYIVFVIIILVGKYDAFVFPSWWFVESLDALFRKRYHHRSRHNTATHLFLRLLLQLPRFLTHWPTISTGDTSDHSHPLHLPRAFHLLPGFIQRKQCHQNRSRPVADYSDGVDLGPGSASLEGSWRRRLQGSCCNGRSQRRRSFHNCARRGRRHRKAKSNSNQYRRTEVTVLSGYIP